MSYVLRGATIVTCDGTRRVLRGDVSVQGGEIRALGKVRVPPRATVIDARDRIVLPGLIMAHVHLCQTLMRGLADDLPLLDWLERRIWPLEAAHDERSLRVSAELGLSELLLSGTTAVLDLGTTHGHDVVFEACVRSGIRVVGGVVLMDRGDGVPARLLQSTRAALSAAEALERRWSRHASDRVRYAYIPRFVLSSSERLIRGAVERAKASDAIVHTHAAEHPLEQRAVRRKYGADDATLLRRWGVRGPRASLAHCVQLSPAQIRALARDGTRAVHCPSANMKLGSGIAPTAELRAAGVALGLGADGAPCNNNLDPFVEMRHAALLAALRSGPGSVPAGDVLAMATIDGARVLGLEHRIGSIEVGKQADLVVLRTDGTHVAPAPDPVSSVVYAARAEDVEHVMVGGRFVVKNGRLLTLDGQRAAALARQELPRLVRRARL